MNRISEGTVYAVATVMQTFGSTPLGPGAAMAVSADDSVVGSIPVAASRQLSSPRPARRSRAAGPPIGGTGLGRRLGVGLIDLRWHDRSADQPVRTRVGTDTGEGRSLCTATPQLRSGSPLDAYTLGSVSESGRRPRLRSPSQPRSSPHTRAAGHPLRESFHFIHTRPSHDNNGESAPSRGCEPASCPR